MEKKKTARFCVSVACVLVALLGVLTGILSFVPFASANQLNFRKNHLENRVDFYYKWKDNTGGIQDLNFSLRADTVDKGRREFQPFNQKASTVYTFGKMNNYVEASNSERVQMDFVRVQGGYELRNVKARSQSDIDKVVAGLKGVQNHAYEEYLREKLYLRYGSEENAYIMPDHPRIAKRYVAAMRPVAQAMAKKVHNKNPREIINYVLSFLQTIPYDQLQSRFTSNGAGFQTPYGLLYGNRGDCDTKSVAFASLVRSFYPDLRMVMVYVPGHAFVGMNFAPQANDFALKLGGQTFVLAEPVGPAVTQIGTIAPSSEALLRGGAYSYMEVPF